MFYSRSFTGQPTVADEESRALDWFHSMACRKLLPNMARSLAAYRQFREAGAFQII